MRLAHIIEQVHGKPWLITPTAHMAIQRLLESKLAMAHDTKAFDLSDFIEQRRPMEITREGVARIHILGVLGQGLAPIEKTCGATDTRDIRAELLDASDRARGILLEIDSPGGMVTGTAETAALVGRIAEDMPVVAYTDSLCASAAYWIASAADHIYASPSAELGSIGVYIPWVDASARYEMMGFKQETISNEGADLKGISPAVPLTAVQREHLQEFVNRIAVDFHEAVSRRDIPASMLRGNTTYGADAAATNLIDDLGSLDMAMQRVLDML